MRGAAGLDAGSSPGRRQMAVGALWPAGRCSAPMGVGGTPYGTRGSRLRIIYDPDSVRPPLMRRLVRTWRQWLMVEVLKRAPCRQQTTKNQRESVLKKENRLKVEGKNHHPARYLILAEMSIRLLCLWTIGAGVAGTIERRIRAHARAKGWAGLVCQRVYRLV